MIFWFHFHKLRYAHHGLPYVSLIAMHSFQSCHTNGKGRRDEEILITLCVVNVFQAYWPVVCTENALVSMLCIFSLCLLLEFLFCKAFQIIKLRIINVRPAFFYTKVFIYNSMAICLIMTKLLHPTIQGPSIYCVKFQGWMCRSF